MSKLAGPCRSPGLVFQNLTTIWQATQQKQHICFQTLKTSDRLKISASKGRADNLTRSRPFLQVFSHLCLVADKKLIDHNHIDSSLDRSVGQQLFRRDIDRNWGTPQTTTSRQCRAISRLERYPKSTMTLRMHSRLLEASTWTSTEPLPWLRTGHLEASWWRQTQRQQNGWFWFSIKGLFSRKYLITPTTVICFQFILSSRTWEKVRDPEAC